MTTEIKICMGSACFARGNNRNLGIIENFIKENHLEAKIVLSGSRCENKCAVGPNLYINGIYHQDLNEEELLKLLEGLKNE